MRVVRLTAGLLGLLLSLPGWAANSAYFRFPAISQQDLVFTAEGDLWTVPLAGGAARRLTSHAAEETRPALSPDGQSVAFSANYEGSTEVYVMPLAGGLPKRISFENSRALALGWSAQGEVLYSAQHDQGPSSLRIVAAVNPANLARRVFPLADANDAVLDARGEYLYFVRFGLASTGDNARTYRGGALSQLWRFKLTGQAEAERIGPQDANLRRPMWWQGRLVVIADMNGRDNLWSLAADGSDARALTQYRDFDVRSAQLAHGRISYQLGADLHVLDLASGQDSMPAISLVSDFDQQRSRWLDKPLQYLNHMQLSPDGERVALTARGQVALAGTGALRRVELAAPTGSRLWQAVPSPDGKWVYAIGDASGEQEIWRLPADGSPAAEQLTHDGQVHRLDLALSPDGKWLAHTDKRARLWLLELATRKNQLIDDAGAQGIEEFQSLRWAPDSQSLAIVRSNSARGRAQLGLFALASKQLHWLSSDKYESGSPAFSPDGRWLYFLSERSFNAVNRSPWGDRNLGPYFDKRSKIYALALQADNRFPFQAKDELSAAKKAPETSEKDEEKDEDKADKAKTGKAPKLPAIVWNGLAERLFEVPLAAGNYSELNVDAKRLYWLERDEGSLTLKTLAIDNNSPKAETFVGELSSYALSQDRKKLLYRKGNELYIVPAAAKAPSELAKHAVRLGDWRLLVDPRQEWTQMFADAWRTHRDFLFDRAMRGVDWPAMRAKYAPLVARVSDRAELDDLLAQMIGEVGALHSQIIPGDVRSADDTVATAGLGAQLERSEQGWLVKHIYRSEAELPSERSPLQAPGVDVREGDLITAINGRPTAALRDLSDLLRNQAGQQVLLNLLRGKQALQQVVVPVNARQHAALRYTDWERSRLERVAQASAGRIGYLHLRAMGSSDIASFAREFYAQYDRDGLIIDVRRNNGGNIDSWIIEKLLRRVWAFWAPPGATPYGNMQQSFRGHLVVLTDALTYSDGETFAAGVKALKLGPLIGTRTAGAGVWLSDGFRLADGGKPRVAENAQFGLDGQWLIEGRGVVPDIEVENPPHATFRGEDRQLETALRYLSDKLSQSAPAPLQALPIPALNLPKE